MSEHLSTEQVEGFHHRSASPAEIVATHSHLAVCQQCRLLLSATESPEQALTGLLAAFAASPEDHLEYEQLASYVDGHASQIDSEIIETHLEMCPECTVELRELSALGTSMKSRPAKEYSAAAPTRFRKRTLTSWQLPGHWIPLQIAAMAAIAVLVIWVATNSLRHQVATLNGRISEIQQTNQALEVQASRAAETQNNLSRLQNEHKALQLEDEREKAKLADLNSQLSQVRQPRDRALSSPSSPSLVGLKDNGRVLTIGRDGNLVEQTLLPAAYQHAVRTALVTERVETPAFIAMLVGKQGLTRGPTDGSAFILGSPVGTAVQSDRPTLRWNPLPGATIYTVAVYDSTFHPVAKSPALSATEWTIPQPLTRGAVYSWQVTALKDGQEFLSPATPAPEARFKVLEQAATREVEKAQQSYANSHLILGILYAKAGLLDEAESEFQALAAGNPGSGSAKKLLDNLRMLRRSK